MTVYLAVILQSDISPVQIYTHTKCLPYICVYLNLLGEILITNEFYLFDITYVHTWYFFASNTFNSKLKCNILAFYNEG